MDKVEKRKTSLPLGQLCFVLKTDMGKQNYLYLFLIFCLFTNFVGWHTPFLVSCNKSPHKHNVHTHPHMDRIVGLQLSQDHIHKRKQECWPSTSAKPLRPQLLELSPIPILCQVNRGYNVKGDNCQIDSLAKDLNHGPLDCDVTVLILLLTP